MQWRELGQGKCNIAHVNKKKTLVFKTQQDKDDIINKPERCVPLWNQIYADVVGPAFIIHDPILGKGWVSPFIPGRYANDAEIAKEMINIYIRTAGKVVFDMLVEGNFLVTKDRAVCVDLDLAIDMRNDAQISQTSIKTRNEMYHTYFSLYGGGDDQSASKKYPISVQTINALFFLARHYPKITNGIDVLLMDLSIREALAKANYDPAHGHSTLDQQIKEKLQNFETKQTTIDLQKKLSPDFETIMEEKNDTINNATNLENIPLAYIKESCIEKITEYLESQPAFMKLFNSAYKTEKINYAINLVNRIEAAQSIQQISDETNAAFNDPFFKNSNSHLLDHIKYCNDLISFNYKLRGGELIPNFSKRKKSA